MCVCAWGVQWLITTSVRREGGQVLISILYAQAGGGDTLGNMELEREKVEKIEKRRERQKNNRERVWLFEEHKAGV